MDGWVLLTECLSAEQEEVATMRGLLSEPVQRRSWRG